MRVFLDANILFSAAKSDGAIRSLVSLVHDRDHECWVDEYVVIEARRNLQSKAKGPNDAIMALDDLLDRCKVSATIVRVAAGNQLDWLPAKDRPVLAAAMALRCQVLVTGDRRHFGAGHAKVFGGVTIHSPRSLAERLL